MRFFFCCGESLSGKRICEAAFSYSSGRAAHSTKTAQKRQSFRRLPVLHLCFVSPPLQIEPAALGFDLVFEDGAFKSCNFTPTIKIRIVKLFSRCEFFALPHIMIHNTALLIRHFFPRVHLRSENLRNDPLQVIGGLPRGTLKARPYMPYVSMPRPRPTGRFVCSPRSGAVQRRFRLPYVENTATRCYTFSIRKCKCSRNRK